MNIWDFLQENNYLVAAVVWVLGEAIKKTDRLNEKYLPLILMPFSVLLSFWLIGVSAQSFAQGILCVGGAILIHKADDATKTILDL